MPHNTPSFFART